MPKISLRIIRGNHPPATAIGRRLPAIRLVADVCLKSDSGFTPLTPAVIDTGAPTSVFPPAVWRHAQIEPLGRVHLGGIVRRQDCKVPAMLANVICALTDSRAVLGPIVMPAYLVEAENAPLLIGMLGFIERGVLRVELLKNVASLRI